MFLLPFLIVWRDVIYPSNSLACRLIAKRTCGTVLETWSDVVDGIRFVLA